MIYIYKKWLKKRSWVWKGGVDIGGVREEGRGEKSWRKEGGSSIQVGWWPVS